MGSYKKKLFIVLLLFLLINFCVCSSVNAGMDEVQYTIDTDTLLKQEQEILATIALSQFSVGNSPSAQASFINWSNNTNYFPYFKYYHYNNNWNIECYFVPINKDWANTVSVDTEIALFGDPNVLIPCSVFQYTTNGYKRFQFSLGGSGNVTESAYSNMFNIPTQLVFYNNNVVNNYKNGITPTTSPWAMLKSAIDSNTSATEDTTQAVNNLRNDFNEEESDSDYSFPTDNPTQDTAEASIDAVFTLFYDKINAWSSAQMQIPIPFTGKYFNIPPNLTQNIINGFPAGNVISRLLGLIWYYLLGVYIIKDVQKYIDGLQTGEILTKTDTNIKTEML